MSHGLWQNPLSRLLIFYFFTKKYIFLRKIGFSVLWNKQFYVKRNIKRNLFILWKLQFFFKFFFKIPPSRRSGPSWAHNYNHYISNTQNGKNLKHSENLFEAFRIVLKVFLSFFVYGNRQYNDSNYGSHWAHSGG